MSILDGDDQNSDEFVSVEICEHQHGVNWSPGVDMKFVPIHASLMDAFVQEEIWAQTCWPDDYDSVASVWKAWNEGKLTRKEG